MHAETHIADTHMHARTYARMTPRRTQTHSRNGDRPGTLARRCNAWYIALSWLVGRRAVCEPDRVTHTHGVGEHRVRHIHIQMDCEDERDIHIQSVNTVSHIDMFRQHDRGTHTQIHI